jgi:hypothetical protein
MFELVKTAIYVSLLMTTGTLVVSAAARPDVRKSLVRPLLVGNVLLVFAVFCSPTIWVAHLAAFLFVPLLGRRRELVAPFYLVGLVVLPSLGQPLAVGGTYLFTPTLSHFLGLGALATALSHRPPAMGRSAATMLPFLAILALLAIAYGRDTSPTNLARVFLDLTFQFGLPFFIIVRAVRTPADFRLAIAGLASATIMLSVLACYEAFRSWPLYYIAWGHYGVEWGAAVKIRGGLMRAAGPYPEPTSFAFNLCIGILAIHAGRTLWTSSFARWSLYGLSGAAIIATQTRGAWIGLVAGLLVYFVTIGEAKRAAQAASAIALAGAALLGLAAISPSIANLTGLTAEGQGTIDYRQQLFSRGIEEIRERPLWGAPRDEVVRQMRDMVQGEGQVDFVNTYIFVGLVSGLIGLWVFVTALTAQGVTAWRTRQRWRYWPTHRPLSGFGLAALVAVLSMLTVTALVGVTGAMLSVTFALISAWSGFRQPAEKATTSETSEEAVTGFTESSAGAAT